MRGRIILAAFLAASCLFAAGCGNKNDGEPTTGEFVSLARLLASDRAEGDVFGSAAAIDGDIAVVGAPGEDGSGTDIGAVYVYYRDQGGTNAWGQVAKLVPSDGGDVDWFGGAVAVSGDTIVVGAPYADVGGTDNGAVYVFYRNQGGTDAWGQVKKITAADGESSDYFGSAVGLDGDTLVVGANKEDGSGTDVGAAYVFYRDQGGADDWGQVAKLAESSPSDSDLFGYSVGISGDLVIVGAPARAGVGEYQGTACIFSRNQGGADAWGQVTEITAADAAAYAYFGCAVAIHGDAVIVGAFWDSGGASHAGAAYVFDRNQGGTNAWGQVSRFSATVASTQAGRAVAIGDTYAAVGAPYAAGGGTIRGEVYVLARNEGGTDAWGYFQTLQAPGSVDNDNAGYAVGVSGDDIIAGIPGDDTAAQADGSARIFKRQ